MVRPVDPDGPPLCGSRRPSGPQGWVRHLEPLGHLPQRPPLLHDVTDHPQTAQLSQGAHIPGMCRGFAVAPHHASRPSLLHAHRPRFAVTKVQGSRAMRGTGQVDAGGGGVATYSKPGQVRTGRVMPGPSVERAGWTSEVGRSLRTPRWAGWTPKVASTRPTAGRAGRGADRLGSEGHGGLGAEWAGDFEGVAVAAGDTAGLAALRGEVEPGAVG